MPRIATANTIINRAAVECGLAKSNDPVSDPDESFVQLTELLNAAGQELVEMHPWQNLRGEIEFTTQQFDSGIYDLPDDFAYMIDQTGWDHTNTVPIAGPLSAQDWTYLAGRDLVSQSIYASFRLTENKLYLYPQPPPAGLLIKFEYIKRDWVVASNQTTFSDEVKAGSDFVLFEPILVRKFLKLKFLDAKGFDTTAAANDFDDIFDSRTGRDEGSPILSAGRNARGYPYIHPYYNIGDTGYGA